MTKLRWYWMPKSRKPVGEPMRHKDVVTAASFSLDGARIVTASADKTAQVWDAESGKPVGKPLRHQDGVSAASFNADGRRIYSVLERHRASVGCGERRGRGKPMLHRAGILVAS